MTSDAAEATCGSRFAGMVSTNQVKLLEPEPQPVRVRNRRAVRTAAARRKRCFKKKRSLQMMMDTSSITESVEKDNYLFVNFDDLSVHFCGLCGLGVAYCAEKV